MLSLYFSEERLLADASYYFFKVVNFSSFWVEHDRFILALSQWLPLLGTKLGLSLKTLILLNSIGHVLFFYIIFLLSRYIFLDKKAGWILLFLQVVAVTHGFFVPMFELYYATCLLVLFHAIQKNGSSGIHMVFLLILSLLILSAHLYAFILLVFVLLFDVKKPFKRVVVRLVPFVAIMIGLLLYKASASSTYENEIIDRFFYQLQHKVINLAYLKSLIIYLFAHHWKSMVFLVFTVALLICHKQKKTLVLLCVFFFGVLAVAVYLSSSFDPSRYNEQIYFPLWFLTAFSLFYGIKNVFTLSSAKWIVTGFYLAGLATILNTQQYSLRLAEMSKLIEANSTAKNTKFFINEKGLIHDPNWSYSIETLLFSAAKGKEFSLTICLDSDFNYEQNSLKLWPNDFLFRRWDIMSAAALNGNYFELKSGPYQEVSHR